MISSFASTVLLALLAAPQAAARQLDTSQAALPERVLATMSEGSPLSTATLFVELSSGAPHDLDALFAVVETGHLPRCSGTDDSDCPHPDPGDQRRLGTLLWDLPTLLAARLGTGVEPPSSAERALVLRVLATTGDADDLPLALRLATRPDEPADFPWNPRDVVRALSKAVGGMLDRDSRTTAALERAFDGVAGELRSPLVLAVGSSPSPEGLDLLSGELGRHEGLNVTLLSQIGRIVGRLPFAANDGARMRIRSYLEDPEAAARREACNVLGRIDDDESVLDLIECLSDKEDAVRRSAHWALGRISQRQIRPDPAQWLGWYQEENLWWREHSQRFAQDLRHGEPGEVSTALNAFAARRLFRRELALEVEVALDHPQSQLARMACGTLFALGSRASVPALVRTLGHSDEEVRKGARSALVQITGMDLGNNPAVWRAHFELPG